MTIKILAALAAVEAAVEKHGGPISDVQDRVIKAVKATEEYIRELEERLVGYPQGGAVPEHVADPAAVIAAAEHEEVPTVLPLGAVTDSAGVVTELPGEPVETAPLEPAEVPQPDPLPDHNS